LQALSLGLILRAMLLATALDTSSKFAFDPARENGGMVAMGVIVLVTWLAFRQMLKLAKRQEEKKP
jgi:hypothetical protein